MYSCSWNAESSEKSGGSVTGDSDIVEYRTPRITRCLCGAGGGTEVVTAVMVLYGTCEEIWTTFLGAGLEKVRPSWSKAQRKYTRPVEQSKSPAHNILVVG